MNREIEPTKIRESTAFDWLGPPLLWIADRIPKTVVGEAHLQAAAEYVNQGEGPLIVMSNHVGFGDPLALRTLMKQLEPTVPVSVLVGEKYIPEAQTDTAVKPGSRLMGGLSRAIAEAAKVTLVSIPQDGTTLGAVRTAASRITAVRDEVTQNNGVLLIYPEGHRHRTMEKGKAGVAFIFRNNEEIKTKARILPVGVEGSVFNPFGKVRHTYGEPVSYQTVECVREQAENSTGEPITFVDACMLLIAALLPPEKRGVYGMAKFLK